MYAYVLFYLFVVDSPKGKLRVLYECMPMAYIIEQVSTIQNWRKYWHVMVMVCLVILKFEDYIYILGWRTSQHWN